MLGTLRKELQRPLYCKIIIKTTGFVKVENDSYLIDLCMLIFIVPNNQKSLLKLKSKISTYIRS